MLVLPLFISGAEIAFIMFILVMVFGADKIPEIARGLGKGMRTLKDATNDIKNEITNHHRIFGPGVPHFEDFHNTFRAGFWVCRISSKYEIWMEVIDDFSCL